jgi:hypothetical protein
LFNNNEGRRMEYIRDAEPGDVVRDGGESAGAADGSVRAAIMRVADALSGVNPNQVAEVGAYEQSAPNFVQLSGGLHRVARTEVAEKLAAAGDDGVPVVRFPVDDDHVS